MPVPNDYPPDLPEELRAWYDSIPVDDEPLSPEDEAARAEGLADLAAGRTISHEELERRLIIDETGTE